jgi:tRNA(Glu) U13 pseudouridine synthase TruD
MYCDNPTTDLLPTDLEKLEGKAQLATSTTGKAPWRAATMRDGRLIVMCACGVGASGRHRAVAVSFTLGSSSYATMLLRELMKQDSSIDVQKRLYASQREKASA